MTTNDVNALQFKLDTASFDVNKTSKKAEEKTTEAVTVPVGQQVSEAKAKVATAIKNNNSLSNGLAGSGISSETSFNDKLYDITDVPDEVKQDSGFKSFMANLWGTKKAESTKTAESASSQNAAAQMSTEASDTTNDVKSTNMSDEKISELGEKVKNGGTLTADEEKALTADLDSKLAALDADFAKDFPDFKPDTSKLSGAKVSEAAESTGASAADIQSAIDFTATHQTEVNNGTVKDCADFKNLPANVQAYALKQYAAAGAGATEN